MPIPALATVVTKYYPIKTYIQIGIFLPAVAVIRAYAQGRRTSRDRDLHGRVVLLTGGFTSLGSTLLEALARRGAHIIALTHLPIEAPEVALIIEALRETTKNENIFAEQCDILTLESTREFCTKFLTGKENRLDAIVFAHEYEHIGPVFASNAERLSCDERRVAGSTSTFLMITLLLPTLLVAPAERDIRIINVVNPFYAAAVPHFPNSYPAVGSQFLREGYRALRSIVLMRHLQRVLDALPQAPAPDPGTTSLAAVNNKAQKSNIVAVSVSPGFSRQDTAASLLRANFSMSEFSFFGLVSYVLLQPLFRVFAKTPSHVVQSVLHALFLPTPFKFLSVAAETDQGEGEGGPLQEALKPGALYSDCSVVHIDLRGRVPPTPVDDKKESGTSEKKMVDDGEYGGEELGRLVWESFESGLKAREKKSTANEGASQSLSNKKDD